MIADDTDGIALTHSFDRSVQRLWRAITNPDELSDWLGGVCSIDARVGGSARFDLPDQDINATGTVRLVAPPQPDHSVVVLEHTFVNAANTGITSVCRWAIRDAPTGCELMFTHDGFGELDRDRFAAWWSTGFGTPIDRRTIDRPTTTPARAIELLRSARRILLVSLIGSEVPDTLLAAGFEVYAKVGPRPDAWARCHRTGGDLALESRTTPPNDVDLVHLDVPEFAQYLDVAHSLGAKTLWFHSARTRPPDLHDDRGCWLPSAQSANSATLRKRLGSRTSTTAILRTSHEA